MSERNCPHCNLDLYCCFKNPNCPYYLGNKIQSAEPSNCDDSSHHSNGLGTGKQFSSRKITAELDDNDIAAVLDDLISTGGKNSTGQLPFPNQTGYGGQPALSDSNEQNRNFEKVTNQVESNGQENSWNWSGEPMQQDQWTNQGLDWICYGPTRSRETSVSHPESTFRTNSQAHQINPSQQQPVAAPNPAPLAATSSEDYQLPDLTGYYGPGNQSGQIVLREGAQHFQNNTRDSATIQDGNLTQQPLAACVPIRTLEIGASGPLSALESIIAENQKSHSLQEPEAGASDSGQNPIGNSTRIVSEPSRFNNPGFCVMCEEYCKNIYTHWSDWHYIKRGDKNPCYQVYDQFDAKFLIPHFTHHDELKQCPTCKNVFFKLRCDKHGCPVQESSSLSAQSNVNFDPVVASEYFKLKGHCLMCKFTFSDVWRHRFEFHKGNPKYIFRYVRGQLTLIPDEISIVNELGQCSTCLKIMYKIELCHYIKNDSFYCPACFPNLITRKEL